MKTKILSRASRIRLIFKNSGERLKQRFAIIVLAGGPLDQGQVHRDARQRLPEEQRGQLRGQAAQGLTPVPLLILIIILVVLGGLEAHPGTRESGRKAHKARYGSITYD